MLFNHVQYNEKPLWQELQENDDSYKSYLLYNQRLFNTDQTYLLKAAHRILIS